MVLKSRSRMPAATTPRRYKRVEGGISYRYVDASYDILRRQPQRAFLVPSPRWSAFDEKIKQRARKSFFTVHDAWWRGTQVLTWHSLLSPENQPIARIAGFKR